MGRRVGDERVFPGRNAVAWRLQFRSRVEIGVVQRHINSRHAAAKNQRQFSSTAPQQKGGQDRRDISKRGRACCPGRHCRDINPQIKRLHQTFDRSTRGRYRMPAHDAALGRAAWRRLKARGPGYVEPGAASARLNFIVVCIPLSGVERISSSAPAFCFRD